MLISTNPWKVGGPPKNNSNYSDEKDFDGSWREIMLDQNAFQVYMILCYILPTWKHYSSILIKFLVFPQSALKTLVPECISRVAALGAIIWAQKMESVEFWMFQQCSAGCQPETIFFQAFKSFSHLL